MAGWHINLLHPVNKYLISPHHIPNSWVWGNDGGGGVVAKPDRLVAFQTLSSERVQQVHLSLSQKKYITVCSLIFIIYC